MGVMGCSRNGCDSVMCDRYSHKYGYICDECFEELYALQQIPDIEKFMMSLKKKWSSNERQLMEDYLNNEFPRDE